MEPKVAPNHRTNEPQQDSVAETGELAGSIFIPDHQLLRRIGRGSYGTVWLAKSSLGAYRAVKIVFRKSFSDQRPFEREWSGIRKFEPISRSHEGFIDVLHVGINEGEGYFYYVMELGDDCESGQKFEHEKYSPHTMAKEINRRGALPVKDCLRLGLALSDALGELHRCGLVHRDIKPSNIIFVNGAPKLADIGLVAGLDDSQSYVGTEGFIPPEGPGSPPADVYSLGKVLYEACTGKDRQDFPELPTLVENLDDRQQFLELNEVILHACKNEAANRYQSASSMHADLVVLANGKSVKRLKLLERRLSNLKRGAGMAALAALGIGLLSYPSYQEWRLHQENRQKQIGSSIAYGIQAMDSGNLTAALPHFANAYTLDQNSQDRSATYRLRFGTVLGQTPKITHLWLTNGEASSGEFSLRDTQALISKLSGLPQVCDILSGQSTKLPYKLTGLRSARYSPDGQYVVLAGDTKQVTVWETATARQVLSLVHTTWVSHAEFSPDGRHILTACSNGLACLWSAKSGQKDRSFGPHSNAVIFSTFSHDGRLVATASCDNTCRLWNVADGSPASPPLSHGNWVNYVAFSPDDRLLVTASWDRKASVWETATGRRVLPNLPHDDGVKSAEFSPDGRLIVTAGADRTVRLWDATTLLPLQPNSILQHGDRATHACFASDGHQILTTCVDGSVRIWDLAGSLGPGSPSRRSFSTDMSRSLEVSNNQGIVRDTCSAKVICQIPSLEKSTTVPQLNRNGRFVSGLIETEPESASSPRRLTVRDANTGQEISSNLVFTNLISGASVSDDGKQAVVFDDKIIQVWDVRTGTALSPPIQTRNVSQAMFNPDGTQMAVRSGHTVRVWDCVRLKQAFAPLEHRTDAYYFAFSSDGRFLVTCCSDLGLTKCYAQVWDAATGKPAGPRLDHDDGVLQASFCSDGRRMVTASEDFTAMIWDFHTGKQLTPPLKQKNRVRSASFSPDGKWVVTTSDEKTARIWDAENGDSLGPPVRYPVSIFDARFLPDGRSIAVLGTDGQAWEWSLRVDTRPLEDLSTMARLLSGAPTELHGGARGGAKSEPVDATWRRLAAKYPSDFSVADDEIAAWHELQAEQSEVEQNWFAVTFHLNRLLLTHPGDQTLAQRLAAARAHLRSPHV